MIKNFFILIFMLVGQVFATETLFIQGNTHYSNERFQEAISDYEKALVLGFVSGPLYYNLGNAYFKSGLMGKAIANYMRAKRLIPRDADLRANLIFAKSLIKEGEVQPREGWISQLLIYLSDPFTLNEMIIFGTFLYLSIIILLLLFVLVPNIKKPVFFLMGPIFIALVLIVSMFSMKYYQEEIQHQAVIVAKEVPCRFEPFEDATTHFILHEGENIMMGSSKSDWLKVKRSDGLLGWVKKNDVEVL